MCQANSVSAFAQYVRKPIFVPNTHASTAPYSPPPTSTVDPHTASFRIEREVDRERERDKSSSPKPISDTFQSIPHAAAAYGIRILRVIQRNARSIIGLRARNRLAVQPCAMYRVPGRACLKSRGCCPGVSLLRRPCFPLLPSHGSTCICMYIYFSSDRHPYPLVEMWCAVWFIPVCIGVYVYVFYAAYASHKSV